MVGTSASRPMGIRSTLRYPFCILAASRQGAHRDSPSFLAFPSLADGSSSGAGPSGSGTSSAAAALGSPHVRAAARADASQGPPQATIGQGRTSLEWLRQGYVRSNTEADVEEEVPVSEEELQYVRNRRK